MSIFQPVELTWKGDVFTVAPDRVMMLIAKIEEIVTLAELVSKRGAPLAKVAMAYGEALRYAGCRVGNDEVYASLFAKKEQIPELVQGLLMMMVPPPEIIEGQKAAPENGEKKPRKGSSKAPT